MDVLPLFGDSLTAGRIGIAYNRYLPFKTLARGIEGEIWHLTYNRLEQAASLSPLTVAVLQSGANDLLIPHMRKTNQLWAAAAKVSGRDRFTPLADDQQFLPLFAQSLQTLRTTYPQLSLIICSITPIGEQLDSELNRKRQQRNRQMHQIVEQIPSYIWCDIAKDWEKTIKQQTIQSPYLLGTPASLEQDAMKIGGNEQKAEALATQRGLCVTVDGVHPNTLGARLIASAITTAVQAAHFTVGPSFSTL